ncbi:MAG: hypothetical protein ACXV7J_00485 [Methylomonas sp.]
MGTLDKTSHYAQNTFGKFAGATAQTADMLAETSENLMNAERRLARNARHVVRDYPLASLGIATVTGFLLSLIFTYER